MDERRLRSRKRARPLSADSGYGSRQQRHGQAFRSPLQIPGRTILSAVHHTLPADIHADSLARNNPDAPAGMHLFIAVSVFVLSIAIAYACLKLYDEPVREWLKQHWLMKKNTKHPNDC